MWERLVNEIVMSVGSLICLFLRSTTGRKFCVEHRVNQWHDHKIAQLIFPRLLVRFAAEMCFLVSREIFLFFRFDQISQPFHANKNPISSIKNK